MACSFVQRSGSIEPEYTGCASREIKNIVYVLRSIYPRHLGSICGLSARSLCDQRAYKIISSNHRNSKTFNILVIFRINIHHSWYHKKYQQMPSPLSATPDYIANITQPRQRVKNDMGFDGNILSYDLCLHEKIFMKVKLQFNLNVYIYTLIAVY